ncbi:MAG: haloacid dehalogenase [Desulfobacteraceae bacterium]|jgi:hypothetical protein
MMIDPRRLAFDVDGVLANTMQLFLDILKDVYGINHIAYEHITQYQLEDCLDVDPEIISGATHRIIEGDYPCQLIAYDGVERVLKRLHAFGPIRLVTARPHLGPIRQWIDQILPPEQYRVDITPTGAFDAKPEVLKAKNIHWFVEDRLDTCHLLETHNITPLVYTQPWNRQPHPFMEVGNWSQLESLVSWSS